MISRLTQLVKSYLAEIERKETDIEQMTKLLCSYEAAINDFERERNALYGPGNNMSRTPEIRASRSQQSDSKTNI